MSDNSSPSDDNITKSTGTQKPPPLPNASGSEARPTTASTIARENHLADPFATPESSRPSSRHHHMHSSKISFSDTSSGFLSAPRTPTEGVFPSATPNHIPVPRSILSNPSRISVIQSARSSAVPLPSGNAIPRKLPRMKSYMMADPNNIPKPWTDKPNPRAKIAYFLTYAVIFIGLAGGIVQCYFNYAHAQLDRKPLCLVMEENFDSEEAVFGENGSFNREVNMDGFGYVPFFYFFFFAPIVRNATREGANSLYCYGLLPTPSTSLRLVFTAFLTLFLLD